MDLGLASQIGMDHVAGVAAAAGGLANGNVRRQPDAQRRHQFAGGAVENSGRGSVLRRLDGLCL